MAISNDQMTALLQGLFGVGGVYITNMTQQLTNMNANLTNGNNQERNTIKINNFAGKEDEDPIEWLNDFKYATITNR